MSTRGFVGVVVAAQEHISYNHHDSYPGGLGVEVLAELRSLDLSSARHQARRIRLVTSEDTPTELDLLTVAHLLPHTPPEQRSEAWAELTERQGSLLHLLESGLGPAAPDFPMDSLFCEWGYLLDLDTQTFEVYKGFQDSPHAQGRFASRPLPQRPWCTGEYYPVALVASWSLSDLPTSEEFSLALCLPEGE